jgi:hypothetical protein
MIPLVFPSIIKTFHRHDIWNAAPSCVVPGNFLLALLFGGSLPPAILVRANVLGDS